MTAGVKRVLDAWAAVQQAQQKDTANLLAGRMVFRETPQAMRVLGVAMVALKREQEVEL